MNDSFPSSDFIILTNGSEFSGLLTTYNDFISRMRRTHPTFDLWSTYKDMVQTLLLFLRATQEWNWELHLAALREMLPWYFAYDGPNYARYGTAYYVEMCALPYTHPTISTAISFLGQWTVQRTGGEFTSIACDQAIEQTVNRDAKTPGRLSGLTRNRGATQRWILS